MPMMMPAARPGVPRPSERSLVKPFIENYAITHISRLAVIHLFYTGLYLCRHMRALGSFFSVMNKQTTFAYSGYTALINGMSLTYSVRLSCHPRQKTK